MQQQTIDFGDKAKSQDNRKIGVAFVCFEDQLMNSSSDLRFSTSTSNWRNVQQALGLGDYGGSFDPDAILEKLQDVKDVVSAQGLNDGDPMDGIIKKSYKIENGTQIFGRLEKIAITAQHAGTKVRIMTGQFIGTL